MSHQICNWCLIYISMSLCKKHVTPLLTYWSYVFMQTEHLVTDPNPTHVHRNIHQTSNIHIFLNFLGHVTWSIYWSEIDKVHLKCPFLITVLKYVSCCLKDRLYQRVRTGETSIQYVCFVHQTVDIAKQYIMCDLTDIQLILDKILKNNVIDPWILVYHIMIMTSNSLSKSSWVWLKSHWKTWFQRECTQVMQCFD